VDAYDDAKHYEVFAKRFTSLAHNVLAREEEGTPEDLLALGDGYLCLMAECQSQIEQMLGAALLFASDGYNQLKFISSHTALSPEELRAYRSDFGTIFYPQAVIDRYRVDFFLVSFCQGHSAVTVVECDGHEFHEKTREQASRDKSRDRAITAAGAALLRFTGSDIHRRLEQCVEEIEGVLFTKVEDVLSRAGIGNRRQKPAL
jgi:very-short-patch-repair endonuclease